MGRQDGHSCSTTPEGFAGFAAMTAPESPEYRFVHVEVWGPQARDRADAWRRRPSADTVFSALARFASSAPPV